MPKVDDIRRVKRDLSARLLRVPGVSGVGVSGGKITVYLAYGSADLRREVSRIVKEVAAETEVRVVVTGRFEALGG